VKDFRSSVLTATAALTCALPHPQSSSEFAAIAASPGLPLSITNTRVSIAPCVYSRTALRTSIWARLRPPGLPDYSGLKGLRFASRLRFAASTIANPVCQSLRCPPEHARVATDRSVTINSVAEAFGVSRATRSAPR